MTEESPCAAPGCSVPCTGRTCSSACRARLLKIETGYRDLRSARRRPNRAGRKPRTRYAVVQVKDTTIEVLALDSGPSKRAVERAFGISERADLAAVAERHLPTAAVGAP